MILGFFSCQKEDVCSKRLDKSELANALGVGEESLFLDEKTRYEFEKNGGVYLKFNTLEEAKRYLSELNNFDSFTKVNATFKKKIDSVFNIADVKKVNLSNRNNNSTISYFSEGEWFPGKIIKFVHLETIKTKDLYSFNFDFTYALEEYSKQSMTPKQLYINDIIKNVYLTGVTYGIRYESSYITSSTLDYNIYIKHIGILTLGLDIGDYIQLVRKRVELFGSYDVKQTQNFPSYKGELYFEFK